MKRKNAMIAGNGLMGVGLVTMIVGISYAVLNELPQLQLPPMFTPLAILGIFIGALLWLVGARVSGREKVADRYYWLRHCGDQRCRRASHHRPHSH